MTGHNTESWRFARKMWDEGASVEDIGRVMGKRRKRMYECILTMRYKYRWFPYRNREMALVIHNESQGMGGTYRWGPLIGHDDKVR